eukprot:scaffold59906_cov48-Phaeocystis_antarctica.AAC.2
MRFLGSTCRSRELRGHSKELPSQSACRKLRAIVESVAQSGSCKASPRRPGQSGRCTARPRRPGQ